jgi:hypothetical protein
MVFNADVNININNNKPQKYNDKYEYMTPMPSPVAQMHESYGATEDMELHSLVRNGAALLSEKR